MTRQILTLTLLITFSISGKTQDVDVNEMVGFGCYFSGTESKPVQKVSQLIDKQKYSSIVKLLESKNNAERFLAVVVCEKLIELGKLKLTKEQEILIAKIYNSDGIVSVCSGCTYWDKLTLKTMLDKENNMRISANYWLDYKFNEN